jgi:dTDP-L-rhamnose 4-epimerase
MRGRVTDHRRRGLHWLALADELSLIRGQRGYRVRVLDVLAPQVHGEDATGYLARRRRAVRRRRARSGRRRRRSRASTSSITSPRGRRRPEHVRGRALHVDERTSARPCCWRRDRGQPVARLIVASSMSVYGEGLYATAGGDRRSRRAARWSSSGRGDGSSRRADGDRSCRCRRRSPSALASSRSTRSRSTTRSGCA